MAVAFDAVGPSSAGASSTGSVTLSWTHTNVAAGVALFVAVAVGIPDDTGVSVSVKLDPVGENTSFTSLGAIVHPFDLTGGFIGLFGLPDVSSGAHTITATAAGGTPNAMEGGSLSYTGADTTSLPFSAQQSAVGNTASPSLAFTASTAGNMVAGAVASGVSITGITTGTSRWIKNVNTATGAGNEAGADTPGTGGSVVLTWASNNDIWAVAAVQVLAAVVPLEGGPMMATTRSKNRFS